MLYRYRREYTVATLRRHLDAGLRTSSATSQNQLYYEELGPPDAKHTMIVLPGLLGVGRNLRSFINNLLKQAGRDEWRALLLDLRCHGKSAQIPSLQPPHTLETAANDVVRLLKNQDIKPDLFIGHSFGGKTALETLCQLTASSNDIPNIPKHVWVLDSKPGLVNPEEGVSKDVLNVLHTVDAIKTPAASRESVLEQLEERGLSKNLRLWLASNLILLNSDGSSKSRKYDWSFDSKGAQELFASYCSTDYLDLLNSPPKGTTIHVVRASKGARWSEYDVEQLKQAEESTAASDDGEQASSSDNNSKGVTRTYELADAGHWMHVDNPKALVDMIAPSMMQ